MTVNILTGDCREVLRSLPSESVHCVVTSPPYWGLRDYGTAKWEGGDTGCEHSGVARRCDAPGRNDKQSTQKGSSSDRVSNTCLKCGARRIDSQIGLEPDFNAYIITMVEVFREVRRVLRKDGTLWLNLGDSYATGTSSGRTPTQAGKHGYWENPSIACRINGAGNGLKPKDLCGIPWRVALALQADGWWLRQDIIWAKPNPMPESVIDRCTKAHEYIFLLSKNARYYFDAEAIKERAEAERQNRFTLPTEHPKAKLYGGQNFVDGGISDKRNKRSVWEIATAPFSEAHFATFPPALIEPCIKAGTSEKGCCAKCGAPWVREVGDSEDYATFKVAERERKGGGMRANDLETLGLTRGTSNKSISADRRTLGWSPSCSCEAVTIPCTVIDPFGGAGTTGLVADRLGRNAILIELNPEYAAMADRRIRDDAGMFASVTA